MGVDLAGFVAKQPIRLEDLSGKTVAVDAFNTLFQFLAALRLPDGSPLKDDQGRVTSHLVGLFTRTANLVGAGILPVFVFDGVPHPLKRATQEERRRVKAKATAEYEEALAAGDLERARMKAQQTSHLTGDMVAQSKELLRLLGLPSVDAPGEGEGQASYLVQRGAAHAVATQDYDVLLYGAPRLVRNLAVTGRRKMPGRQAWVDVEPDLVVLAGTLEAIGVSREQLIELAVLIGTDYNEGVPGIGPKTALELVKEHRTLEAMLEWCESAEGGVAKKLREGQDGLGDFETIRSLFLQPEVAAPVDFKAGRLDERGVEDYLAGFRFGADRVKSGLAKYAESKIYKRQKSLAEWG